MSTNTRRTATVRAADNEPFDFNLDTVKDETDLTPFRLHWAGKRWEFEHMQKLDLWTLVAGAAQGDLGATAATFKAALGAEQYREFRKIPLPQGKAEALFNAYAEFCGVDLGELQGSTDS